MPEIGCPHCGQIHPAESRFCPETGQPLAVALDPSTLEPRPPAGVLAAPRTPGSRAGSVTPAQSAADPATPISIAALLGEAVRLYRQNFVPLVMTCALVLVPLSIIKDGTVALILAPVAAVDGAAQRSAALAQKTADELRRDLAEVPRDSQAAADFQRKEQRRLEDLSRNWAATETTAAGGVLATLLGFVASLLAVALLYGAGVPLATAALTVVVADRVAGGDLRPAAAYKTVADRLPKLLGASLPAFLLVLLGLILLFIPGLAIAFLFAFVTPVVMLEDIGGTAALRRSANLVRANAMQVLSVALVFLAVRIATSILASLFVPRGAFLTGSVVEDAFELVLLPLPIVGTVLLYMDARRRSEAPLFSSP